MSKKRTRTKVYELTVCNIHRAWEYAHDLMDVFLDFCEERCERINGDSCKDCPGKALDDDGYHTGECMLQNLTDTLDETIDLIREVEEFEQ